MSTSLNKILQDINRLKSSIKNLHNVKGLDLKDQVDLSSAMADLQREMDGKIKNIKSSLRSYVSYSENSTRRIEGRNGYYVETRRPKIRYVTKKGVTFRDAYDELEHKLEDIFKISLTPMEGCLERAKEICSDKEMRYLLRIIELKNEPIRVSFKKE